MESQTEVKYLDHGIVALLDTMGDDHAIAEAARGSYKSNKDKVHTATDDRNLVRYLVRHRHTSPLEMAEVKFFLKVPIFVMRQLVRHRTANINEMSARYSELPDEFYIPDVNQCGPQSKQNNQGRAEVADPIRAAHARQKMADSMRESYNVYDSVLHANEVSREIARIVLPVSIYTELYWKCDLHNFFHFAKLRLDKHAQWEIRVLAQAMYDCVRPLFPEAAQAFEDYILNARTLSALDQTLLSRVIRGEGFPSLDDAKAIGMSVREYNEFVQFYDELCTRS